MTYNNQPSPYGQPANNPLGGAPAYQPGPVNEKRTFGMWSLWLGIAGLIIPIGLISLAALVFGIVALVKEPRAKVLGIWGVVLGGLGLIWTLIFWSVIVPLIILFGLGAAYVNEYGTYTSY